MRQWKTILLTLAVLVIVGGSFGAWWAHKLSVAHSTFENYYAFRGCATLLDRTDTYGTCTTASGKTIKIVKYEGRWFLDGDLPCKSGLCW